MSLTPSRARAAEDRRRTLPEGEETSAMNGNIDDELDIEAGDAAVTVTGWIDFDAGAPASVKVWVGISQGDKKKNAVFADGWTTVPRPNGGGRTTWTCSAAIDAPGGTFKNGIAGAGAVAMGDQLEPYPWGRDVKLKK
jgi:hypothetical protein